jgi:Uma2 family endonuclease
MVSQISPAETDSIIYPESDGKPMADNTKQFRWIAVIEQNLEWLYADNSDVFVAGDLLWYPIEGRNNIATAPDALVVFGRPKGDRGSYRQWQEEGIAPQVVFEILSPSNTNTEMSKKLLFYDRYGVEEYYIYNPDNNNLEGWLRVDGELDSIVEMQDWKSPRLGIKFDISATELQIYRPDGSKFFSYSEINRQLETTKQEAETARQRADRAEELLRQYRERFGNLENM